MSWIENAINSARAEKERRTEIDERTYALRKKMQHLWRRLAELWQHDVAEIEHATKVELKVHHSHQFFAVSRPINDFMLMVTWHPAAGLIRCDYGSSIPNAHSASWTLVLSEGEAIEVHGLAQGSTSCEHLGEVTLGPIVRAIA